MAGAVSDELDVAALNELYKKDVREWTDEELIQDLKRSYSPSVIPPCCICGKKLTLLSSREGYPIVYACLGYEYVNERRVYDEGRSLADAHYSESRYEDKRQGGDFRVMEVLKRWGFPR
jgi:hypothetical protein